MKTQLPPDGTEVTAMTLGNPYLDLAPRKVRGKLSTRYVSAWNYTQCDVDGEQVNPKTIQVVKVQEPKQTRA